MSLQDVALAAAAGGTKKDKASLTKKFSNQLVDLISNIRGGELHFVRCIKPNHALAAANFDGVFINTQLRYSGMMAAVDVRLHGFPVRMPLREFHHQFQCLVSQCLPALQFCNIRSRSSRLMHHHASHSSPLLGSPLRNAKLDCLSCS